MRKYYLFVIQKDFYEVYKNNSFVLFKTLENLWRIKKTDFSYGLSLYDALCQTFDVPLLNRYFKGKYASRIVSKDNRHIIVNEKKHYYVLIELHYSCTIVLTNINMPNVLRDFNYYNRRIFVCDFVNEDFFWLDNQYQKTVS